MELPDGKPHLYWQVIGAVGSFGDRRALSVVGKYLLTYHDQPRARDLLFSMQSNRLSSIPGSVTTYSPSFSCLTASRT